MSFPARRTIGLRTSRNRRSCERKQLDELLRLRIGDSTSFTYLLHTITRSRATETLPCHTPAIPMSRPRTYSETRSTMRGRSPVGRQHEDGDWHGQHEPQEHRDSHHSLSFLVCFWTYAAGDRMSIRNRNVRRFAALAILSTRLSVRRGLSHGVRRRPSRVVSLQAPVSGCSVEPPARRRRRPP